jgi:hypothetical protein
MHFTVIYVLFLELNKQAFISSLIAYLLFCNEQLHLRMKLSELFSIIIVGSFLPSLDNERKKNL